MAGHDLLFRDALGARKAHVVLVHLVHHVAAQPHRVGRGGAQRHGEDRQNPRQIVRLVKEHGDAQRRGAVELDEDVVHGGGNGIDEDDEHRAELIPELALASCHRRAQRNTHHQRQRHGQHAQLDGDGRLLGDDAGNRRADAVTRGIAQIALQQVLQEVKELHGNGIVQAQLFELGVDGRLIGLFKVVKIALNRHLAQEHKDHRDDDQQRHQ